MSEEPIGSEPLRHEDLRVLLEQCHVAVVQVDTRGSVVYSNGAFARLVGQSEADLRGRLLAPLIASQRWSRLASMMPTLATGAVNHCTFELDDVGADIDASSWRVNACALGADGDARITLMIEEVAARNPRRETQLLQEARAAAEQQKTEFLALLSHELRNPLAPIRNAARIARTPTTTPEQLHWSLAVIERQVKHMARLVDDLLDVSRITRGKLELRIEQTKLNDALTAAVELSRPLIESRRHKLHIEIPAEPLWVDGDPVRLAQIFGNLVTNAAKYTHQSGLISICASREGDEYHVVIRDTGEGIDAELLPQMFTMFAQGASSTGGRQGGLGIGLALVDGLVKLHHGSVTAKSQGRGRGSEFTVRLPVASKVNVSRSSDMQGETPVSSSGLRILVADDNIDAADSLAMLLRLQGHEVRVAHDGMGAVREAEAFRPDVALVDIGMPIMNGHDVARWIRSQSWGTAMKVIALTGWNQPMDRVQTSLSGFDKHLAKPVAMQDLSACFAEVQRKDRAEHV